MSYCLSASCLAHRERVFWHPWFGSWMHTNCSPCEALAGEPDPTELRCARCGQRTEVDGAGHLWTYVPAVRGCSPAPAGWTDQCPAAPGGPHVSLLGSSQAAG